MAAAVRILSLLIFIACMASARPSVLSAGGVLLLVAGAWQWRQGHGIDAAGLLRMLSRVRWLLLAILILYGWFTPGELLLPALAQYSPSVEGLQQGLLRAAVVLLIVAAVYLLLTATPRGELLAGLLWYGGPLRRLGIDDRRFAIRLILALEAVAEVQSLARDAIAGVGQDMPRLQRIGAAATAVFQATLARADVQPVEIQLPDPRPVPAWQWAVPGLLAAVLLSAAAV